MPSIVERAEQIILEREYHYDIVLADMYFMAALGGDMETAQQIRQEAWDHFNGHLLALLVSIEIQINAMSPSPEHEREEKEF
jgi:hypothetical protein